MQTNDNYIQQINEILSKFNPYLILLFGSYAYGTPDEDSDIDILVVTQDDFIPKNFAEKSKIYQKISRAISSVNEKVAIDLIVHTLPMYKKFIEIDSSFAHEIITKGKIIYESNNTRMA
ncbi:MAG: nucleotidyltransferase domain-containing protein [Bacteroidota bacterium]|nr:nucleotidyltransferase domain-containing protein [Bacteroidota bacterium]